MEQKDLLDPITQTGGRDGQDSTVVEPVNTPVTLIAEKPVVISEPNQPKDFKKLLLFCLLGIGLVFLSIFGYRWWQFVTTHQETDDAYVTSDIHPITARISGTVTEVNVQDNQVVSAGTTLVKLDPRDYQVSLKQARASLAVAKEQANVAQASIGVSRSNTGVSKATTGVTLTNAQGLTTSAQGNIDAAIASISMTQAALAEARAGVPLAESQKRQVKANLVKAKLDYIRYTELYRNGAVPRQQLDLAKANYDSLVAQMATDDQEIKQAKSRVVEAEKNLTNAQAKLMATKGAMEQARSSSGQTQVNLRQTQANQRQTEVSQKQYDSALAAIAQVQTSVENAQLQLSYTNITAPTAGQVGNKTVQVGQRVQPGETLMSLVSQQPWVIANFKETQLGKVKPGQVVEIKLDSFSDRIFKGKIDSVSPASGAKFALLPPDNATGNFTKIVQRLPVKVVFEARSIKGYESRIAPGMSAVVTVETR
jgi:membrane fusion protein (multidrug efflux system)